MEILNSNWGYTEKGSRGNPRVLLQEEHEELEAQRQQILRRLSQIVKHTQITVNRFLNNDPEVKGNETVVIILNGYDSYKIVSESIGFDQLRRTFRFGSPFEDGWLVSVADAVELKDRFVGHVYFPGEQDISKQISHRVSPYRFDPANLANLDSFFAENK